MALDERKRTSMRGSFFKLLTALIVVSSICPPIAHAIVVKGGNLTGRVNAWTLYETDDLSNATVALVYDTTTSNLLGAVVGRDIGTECSKPNRTCTYRVLGGDGKDYEVTLNKVTDTESSSIGQIGSDALLMNLGVDSKYEKNEILARINGNFTMRALESRTLYGAQRFRPKFMDAYVQYSKDQMRYAAGRKVYAGQLLVDGASAEYLFGPQGNRDSKAIGFFAGLTPDPISKYPGLDEFSFGPTFRYIPEFSISTDTKLIFENSLVTSFYNSPDSGYEPNRFYLFNRVHFTPIKTFSLLGLSTLDLPGAGRSDTGLKSTHFSLQSFWRPQPEWFTTIGFSQFRIDRFMEQEAVRWVTESSAQSLRVSDSLDHSQRYRIDARVSYRPFHPFQPYARLRYERRTFDSNKTSANVPLTATTPGSTNLALFGRKDAYRGTLGTRLFFLDDKLETDSAFTYNQRFLSKGWDLYQGFFWDSGSDWSADTYVQYVSSERTIQNSIGTVAGTAEKAIDFYIGVGGSYRFLSDFLGQIRYDFSSEADPALDTQITIHTGLIRLDYTF